MQTRLNLNLIYMHKLEVIQWISKPYILQYSILSKKYVDIFYSAEWMTGGDKLCYIEDLVVQNFEIQEHYISYHILPGSTD